MSIQESNKLIFDFMGCTHSDCPDIDKWEMGDLKYHSNWQHLMPVVERIAEKVNVVIKVGACHIFRRVMAAKEYAKQNSIDSLSEVPPITEHIDKGFIGNVYQCVIDYIIWHNSQQSNTTQ